MNVKMIGEALDAGWTVTVYCAYGRREGLKSIRECRHRHDIDLPTLVWTRGRGMTLAMLPERMRCPRCGSRRVRLVFTPPDGRTIAAA
ncbi:hypothetical protein GCM10011335_28980 [Aureimonas glaciei]|uniref:Uncharacterized protein n=1 Tax=Aureimonas glaciei TaxID=1776957 RepID=A0A916XZW1_9HYPH|nr:hypothetical protein GCM10011335_28980 [Aureimonas glaciei]